MGAVDMARNAISSTRKVACRRKSARNTETLSTKGEIEEKVDLDGFYQNNDFYKFISLLNN